MAFGNSEYTAFQYLQGRIIPDMLVLIELLQISPKIQRFKTTCHVCEQWEYWEKCPKLQ